MELNMYRRDVYNKLLNKTCICILFTILGMLTGIFFIPPALAFASMLFIVVAFIAILFMRKAKLL
ncbi:hypothetical protein HBE96_17185 [Clostridium sp. P21]|uniref:Uncharacterized protein n=1 Tax=Clostridium muellerianum TaxID=2716538 RepID=A0A7Y0EJ54_9CLOT|nr:hypothetical protein [Clostridium muellerianum]NMM64357.1 hypothetical protein [Clostridium muellerianum]